MELQNSAPKTEKARIQVRLVVGIAVLCVYTHRTDTNTQIFIILSTVPSEKVILKTTRRTLGTNKNTDDDSGEENHTIVAWQQHHFLFLLRFESSSQTKGKDGWRPQQGGCLCVPFIFSLSHCHRTDLIF